MRKLVENEPIANLDRKIQLELTLEELLILCASAGITSHEERLSFLRRNYRKYFGEDTADYPLKNNEYEDLRMILSSEGVYFEKEGVE